MESPFVLESDESATPFVDKKRKIDDENLNEVLALLQQTLTPTEEDQEQVSFVTALQKNRQFLLQYAMKAYMEKPGSASLLEGVTSLLAHMEKAIRDDRKERMKKQENQDNKLSFNQMLEAMSMIKTGAIQIPIFDVSSFMLDPSVSLTDGLDVKPINEAELVQGNQIISIDGTPV
ncbi:hypothetical protein D3C79_48390 [compost metagenome]